MNMTEAPSGFETMRRAMVASQLRTSAVSDTRVVEAMAVVARERYLPETVHAAAYTDRTLPIGHGRAQNTPLATGRLLTEAQIFATDHVLLIGAARGYTAAVLSLLAKTVVAVEQDAELAEASRKALSARGNVEVIEAPLKGGWIDRAPYDAIVIDGAIEHLPETIVLQARTGARITTGLNDRGVTRLAAGQKTDGGFGLFAFADVECALLPGFAPAKGFVF